MTQEDATNANEQEAEMPPHAEPPGDNPPDPMIAWERIAAGVAGLAAGGAGGAAVFITDNQAGSAALALVGAAFLFVAVQGTPLIRIGAGSNSLELERRRQRLKRAVERAEKEGNVDAAYGIIEGARIAEPEIEELPEYQALMYEDYLATALTGLGARVARLRVDQWFDMLAQTASGSAAVVVKYREHGPLGLKDLERADYATQRARVGGVLVVTNAPLSGEVEQYNASRSPDDRPIEAVTWNDARDNGLLARALARTARQ
ncbi:hypothetical protein [Micromonospora ureilytica]|uniref:Restriction endonuclease type IV Mrr domain-containing protein n=1 Tax=Micromonospora ureilytica TaxID=709868 RepID=A0ABS0JPD5_9ACTN|nr:hypothetical protein [Micromonospora ureilytica]MBG6068914.1 hypothetical protein [Micromonospora ureilytica]